MKIMKYSCAYCQKKACHHNEPEKAPENCPTIRENGRLDQITELYKDTENYKIANAAARIVMDQYGTKIRVQEIIDFCHEMGYQKLGLAFCVGLLKEARISTQILEKHGFDVESVICKLGSVNRDTICIENCDVPMCNPIAQAEFLNSQHTDFQYCPGVVCRTRYAFF